MGCLSNWPGIEQAKAGQLGHEECTSNWADCRASRGLIGLTGLFVAIKQTPIMMKLPQGGALSHAQARGDNKGRKGWTQQLLENF